MPNIAASAAQSMPSGGCADDNARFPTRTCGDRLTALVASREPISVVIDAVTDARQSDSSDTHDFVVTSAVQQGLAFLLHVSDPGDAEGNLAKALRALALQQSLAVPCNLYMDVAAPQSLTFVVSARPELIHDFATAFYPACEPAPEGDVFRQPSHYKQVRQGDHNYLVCDLAERRQAIGEIAQAAGRGDTAQAAQLAVDYKLYPADYRDQVATHFSKLIRAGLLPVNILEAAGPVLDIDLRSTSALQDAAEQSVNQRWEHNPSYALALAAYFSLPLPQPHPNYTNYVIGQAVARGEVDALPALKEIGRLSDRQFEAMIRQALRWELQGVYYRGLSALLRGDGIVSDHVLRAAFSADPVGTEKCAYEFLRSGEPELAVRIQKLAEIPEDRLQALALKALAYVVRYREWERLVALVNAHVIPLEKLSGTLCQTILHTRQTTLLEPLGRDCPLTQTDAFRTALYGFALGRLRRGDRALASAVLEHYRPQSENCSRELNLGAAESMFSLLRRGELQEALEMRDGFDLQSEFASPAGREAAWQGAFHWLERGVAERVGQYFQACGLQRRERSEALHESALCGFRSRLAAGDIAGAMRLRSFGVSPNAMQQALDEVIEQRQLPAVVLGSLSLLPPRILRRLEHKHFLLSYREDLDIPAPAVYYAYCEARQSGDPALVDGFIRRTKLHLERLMSPQPLPSSFVQHPLHQALVEACLPNHISNFASEASLASCQDRSPDLDRFVIRPKVSFAIAPAVKMALPGGAALDPSALPFAETALYSVFERHAEIRFRRAAAFEQRIREAAEGPEWSIERAAFNNREELLLGLALERALGRGCSEAALLRLFVEYDCAASGDFNDYVSRLRAFAAPQAGSQYVYLLALRDYYLNRLPGIGGMLCERALQNESVRDALPEYHQAWQVRESEFDAPGEQSAGFWAAQICRALPQPMAEMLGRERRKYAPALGRVSEPAAWQVECSIGKTSLLRRAEATAGVCTSGDNPDKGAECQWNNPDYFLMGLREAQSKMCAGSVTLIHHMERNSRILIVHPDPSSTFLFRVNQTQFWDSLRAQLALFATDNQIDMIGLDKKDWTNRRGSEFELAIAADVSRIGRTYYPEKSIVFSHRPAYLINAIDIVWENSRVRTLPH